MADDTVPTPDEEEEDGSGRLPSLPPEDDFGSIIVGRPTGASALWWITGAFKETPNIPIDQKLYRCSDRVSNASIDQKSYL